MNSPAEIAQNYVKIGTGKARQKVSKTFALAILAGVFIAVAGVGSTAAAVSVPLPSVNKFLQACIFPGGLAMVILAGSELFTGNCLMVIPVLEKEISLMDMLKAWVIVWVGNLVGGLLIGAALAYSETGALFSGAMAETVVSVAVGKVHLSFGVAFLKGIMCNVLVCLAVWMAFAAKTAAGKIISEFFPIMIFVVSGYEHCVANMYYISAGIFCSSHYGIAAEGLTWGAFFIKNLLPVTLGNIVGGALIGIFYWFIYLKKD